MRDFDFTSLFVPSGFKTGDRQHGVGERNAGESAAEHSEEPALPAAGPRQHAEGAACRDPQVTAAVHR